MRRVRRSLAPRGSICRDDVMIQRRLEIAVRATENLNSGLRWPVCGSGNSRHRRHRQRRLDYYGLYCYSLPFNLPHTSSPSQYTYTVYTVSIRRHDRNGGAESECISNSNVTRYGDKIENFQ